MSWIGRVLSSWLSSLDSLAMFTCLHCLRAILSRGMAILRCTQNSIYRSRWVAALRITPTISFSSTTGLRCCPPCWMSSTIRMILGPWPMSLLPVATNSICPADPVSACIRDRSWSLLCTSVWSFSELPHRSAVWPNSLSCQWIWWARRQQFPALLNSIVWFQSDFLDRRRICKTQPHTSHTSCCTIAYTLWIFRIIEWATSFLL